MRLQSIPPVSARSQQFSSVYSARLAQGRKDVRPAQELRYRVFNQEMEQALPQADESGLDQDFFDVVCDHLVVEHVPTAQIVGTYRLQPGPRASRQLGFYKIKSALQTVLVGGCAAGVAYALAKLIS